METLAQALLAFGLPLVPREGPAGTGCDRRNAGGLSGSPQEDRRFSPGRSGDTFRGWLHAITRNKLIDHFRRLSQQPELLGTWDGLLPVESYDPQEHQSDRHVLLARALDLIRAEFSEVSWEAFWRTVVDGEPTDVVAQGLGISTNAVFIVKSRILQRLRNEFQDLTD